MRVGLAGYQVTARIPPALPRPGNKSDTAVMLISGRGTE